MSEAPSTTADRLAAMDDPRGPVRLQALRALLDGPPSDPREQEALADKAASLLADDPAPLVRRVALVLLLVLSPPRWERVLVALSDPVWRVRYTAVRHLGALGRERPELRGEIRRRLAARRATPAGREAAEREAASREAGALRALEDEWGEGPGEGPGEGEPKGGAARAMPCWDEDPAVLLDRLRREDLRPWAPALVDLLRLDDGKQLHETMQGIRAMAVEGILAHGGPDQDEATLGALSEPRHPYLVDAVRHFLTRLPEPRQRALRERVRARPEGFAPAARRWAEQGALPGDRGPSYFSPRRGDQGGPLAAQPAQAARAAAAVERRALGEGGPRVGPLGLSGRYGLGGRGYARAIEAGVDLLFWEPSYEGLGRFIGAMPGERRRALTVVGGSFEATPAALRRDLEQALRLLKLDVLPVFLLFWVRSAGRIDDEAVEALERLRSRGLLGSWGLSTHDRGLAVEALGRGARVLMVRHSAAHRGAEAAVLPAARAGGAGVLTFSCTCYGKLLEPTGGGPAPAAPDLYRYVLSQPGVTACISAPRSEAELEANLAVLTRPDLGAEEQAWLRRHGDAVYLRSRRFFELLRTR